MNQSSTLCAERSIIPNTRWMYMVREETDKKANDLQTKLFVARYLENMSDARKLRCVYFVDIQHMKNSRRLWTMRVESWKFRCQQQCLAEPDAKSTVKPAAFWTNVRQNTHTAYGRNSTPRSWRSYCREESQPLQSCAQVSSDASCDAKTRCESSSGERMGKLEKMPAWQLTKVRNKKEVTAEWSKEWTQNSTCASMDLWHLGNSELESQCHEQSSCSRRWHSRRWSRLLRSVFLSKDHRCHKWRLQKSWTTNQDFQDVQDRQLMQHPLIPRQRMEDAPQLLKIPRVRMSRHLDSSATTQMA